MHVAYLLSDLGGGTGHHLLSLLERRPHDAWSAEIVSEIQSTVRAEFPVPTRVLTRPSRFARYPLLQAFRYRELESYFRTCRPEILHTYFFWSIMYGRVLKARGEIDRLVENREDLGFNWGWFEYVLLNLTRNIPDRIVCVCEAVKRTVLENEGADPERTVVIRNGVEPRNRARTSKVEAKAALDLRPDRPVVGMVANFDRPIKGIRYFLEAIPHVVRKVPGTQFLLVGGGSTERQLRAEVRERGIEDLLRITGFEAEVGPYYAAMDLSVLTSLSEGLSLTLLESMSWGVPTVATRVGGTPELVVDGETGLLVPPRNVSAFASAVVRVLSDTVLQARLGAAGADRVRESFSIDQTIRSYEQLYQELISSDE